MSSWLKVYVVSLYMATIAHSNPHNTLESDFQYGNQCFVFLVDVAFAYFGIAIFTILAHFPMCNLLQMQFLIFSIHQRIKLYHLQYNRLP